MGRVQLSQGCRATTKRKFIYNRKSPGILRSSHQRCPAIKGVLRNFAKLTGKHLCQSLFSNKVASLSSAQVLSCEFREMPKSTFFTEHLRATASEYLVLIWLTMQGWNAVLTLELTSAFEVRTLGLGAWILNN